MSTPASTRSNWLTAGLTLAAFVLLLGVPFLLRPEKVRLKDPLELVVISPHDEGVKAEFERAFNEWHQRNYDGQAVKINWPNLGGAGDIDRYVASQFGPKLRDAWGGPLPAQIDWQAVDRSTTRPDDQDEQTRLVRDRLANVGIGIDVYFGGGEYPHSQFKQKGWTAPIDLRATPPGQPKSDYLDVVPPQLYGMPLYDSDGYWYGAVLTQVGIVANRVVCEKLNLPVPTTWADLGEPHYRDRLALADPNFSGSAKLCYEMVLQKHGWQEGWPMLTEIAANARYFGSSSTQVALDVSRCEAVAGMIIDYYGRTQVDYTGRDPDGRPRLVYTSPANATATTPDPISIMRGAEHRELAERFVRFVLSEQGQKLWMGKVGSPGGPKKFALYRPPIRPDIYSEFPDTLIFADNPYAAANFNMDSRMQGRRFNFLGAMMKAAFIDNADLLKRAADYVRPAAAQGSPAQELFATPAIPEGDYAARPPAEGTMWEMADRYRKSGELGREQMASELTELFRKHYQAVLDASDRPQ